MKRFILIQLFIAFAFAGYASSIEVSDTIYSDSLWTGIDTVKLTGDIVINDGVTLTIDPGIVIEAQGMYGFTIFGNIVAIGTETDSIIFTALDKVTGWNRFLFDIVSSANDSSIFEYCIIEYGKPENNSGTVKTGGAFMIEGGKLRISHCTLRKNSGLDNVIDVLYCGIVVTHNMFTENESTCISTVGAFGSLVANNRFINNDNNAIGSTNADKSTYVNNLIVGNQFGIFGYDSKGVFVNNTVLNNLYGIFLNGNSDISFYNNIIRDNNYNIQLHSTLSDPDFYNCNIEGGVSGFLGNGAGGNYDGNYENGMDADPQFTDAAAGDYSIGQFSPCINAGYADTTGLIIPGYDLAGEQRIENDTIDIGAWEKRIDPPVTEIDFNASLSNDSTLLVFDVQFDKDITGLEITDFNVTNGTADNLVTVTVGLFYRVEVTGFEPGIVMLEINENSVAEYHGYGNAVASDSHVVPEQQNEEPGEQDDLTYKKVNTLNVYPNPVKNTLFIESTENSDISVVDILGNEVLKVVGLNSNFIDLSDVQPGIYIITVKSGTNCFTKRIIKK